MVNSCQWFDTAYEKYLDLAIEVLRDETHIDKEKVEENSLVI